MDNIYIGEILQSHKLPIDVISVIFEMCDNNVNETFEQCKVRTMDGIIRLFIETRFNHTIKTYYCKYCDVILLLKPTRHMKSKKHFKNLNNDVTEKSEKYLIDKWIGGHMSDFMFVTSWITGEARMIPMTRRLGS